MVAYVGRLVNAVNFEGDGFEPVVKSLFGEKGLVPDTFFKLLDWSREQISSLRPGHGRMKRQVSDDLVKGISDVFQKLMEDLRSSEAPEAVAYFELLGTEMGYMKSNQIRDALETLSMYHHVLFKMLPTSALFKLTSGLDNEVFAHYIFMETGFALPTLAGMPLKFSLTGVVAPGAKGGLTNSPYMGSLSFMPSVGVEFITNMGVQVPEYVEARLQMLTTLHHESSLNAKVTWDRNQIKVNIPAPSGNTELFRLSNKVLSISAGESKMVPSLMEDRTDSTECQPFITGLKLCFISKYSNAAATNQAPYFPLTGESRFAVEIQSMGDVSEYVASLSREMFKEGNERVTALKLSVKAEGVDAAELMASLKYSHNKNTVLTEFNIPDYDIEAGINFSLIKNDPATSAMRGITIDVTNKNVPQLSLTARTRLERMEVAMLQLQMTLPSLNAHGSITSTLNIDDITILDIATNVNLPETTYQQKASLRYDDNKIQLELKTDANSDIQKLIPNAEDHHRQLQQILDDLLDQRVAKTDMKLRHIVTKGIEGFVHRDAQG
uniref:Vitellinogen open beta-sheet domain-containing protein n=1 Tax=Knipowitschia caucasica TaxID=637954 RepID=A0AAV2JEF2_KNICA